MMQEIRTDEMIVSGPEYKDDNDDEVDSFEGDDVPPPTERWAPIGASDKDITPPPSETHASGRMQRSLSSDDHKEGGRCSPPLSASDGQRLRELEEEQEQLNSSLLTLTTHFAQVQFRLQQICKSDGADPADKEKLLRELEEFAFKGCPDIMEVKRARQWHSNNPAASSTTEHEHFMETQRAKQLQLIGQLKDQLEDMERFAYESGEGIVPTSDVLEKQRVIIDQLKDRMDLKLENLDRMSQDELQSHVDLALKRLINPMKVKEKLVEQLKTQITDLERFVEFLQGENGGKPLITCCCETDKVNCILHNGKFPALAAQAAAKRSAGGGDFTRPVKDASSSTLVVSYLLSQLGCQSQKFHKNQLKTTEQGNHWGDLRAALELSVDTLMEVARRHETDTVGRPAMLNPYSSDDDEEIDDVFDKCHEELVSAVRKQFAPALRDLLQHGMLADPSTAASHSRRALTSAVGCFPARARKTTAAAVTTSANKSGKGVTDGITGDHTASMGSVSVTARAKREPHAWDIFVQYYDMKHGREFSEAPVRKLSQSFNLENIGGRAITSKQMLLTTIDNIQTSHTRLKRSPDAMFKAFISAALNHKKLVPWIRMVLKTREIVEENYVWYSYVAKTGCEDAFSLLEKLNQFNFQLPVDLAVRPFQHIKDAF